VTFWLTDDQPSFEYLENQHVYFKFCQASHCKAAGFSNHHIAFSSLKLDYNNSPLQPEKVSREKTGLAAI
jgi:hypothetical protein